MFLQKNSKKSKAVQSGAALVEYALTLALICVISIISVEAVGGSVAETFSNIDAEFSTGGQVALR
jgi:Flp pilus assembly pilin Flp